MSDPRPTFEDAQKLIRARTWNTWDEGPIRASAMPHQVVGDYSGHPHTINFGAFLGWQEYPAWWLEMIARVPLETLETLELLDVGHQAGGHYCTAFDAVAKPVQIAEDRLDFISALCRDYFYAHSGWFLHPTAEVVAEYHSRLSSAGLTALTAYQGKPHEPMEAVYRMDGTEENLRNLLADPEVVLRSLQPFCDLPEVRSRMQLFILADNSD